MLHTYAPTHIQAAIALADQGIEVCQGNLLDRPFLDQAMVSKPLL